MGLIAFSRGKAIYVQIAEILEDDIRRRYQRGEVLPSEEQLTARFGVNRHTLRRAVEELVNIGLVERRHGVGIFVLNSSIDYKLGHKTRFTQALTDLGHSAGTQILRKEAITASEGIARRLGIDEGDELVWIETLREVDGSPFCIISHFLSRERFGAALTDYTFGSLHGFLESTFGIKLRRSSSLISTVLPQGDDGRLLAAGRYQPLLRVKSVNNDQATGQPVEYALSRFRGDRAQLSVDF